MKFEPTPDDIAVTVAPNGQMYRGNKRVSGDTVATLRKMVAAVCGTDKAPEAPVQVQRQSMVVTFGAARFEVSI